MKTFITISLFLILSVITENLIAQNIFPSTGRVGIYTTSPTASLQVKGGARFGTIANYVNIDSATGNLSFAGTSGYQVGGNKYAFQYTGNPNYGLFFNSSAVQYEFRNGSAVPVFSVNANTGNSVFNGTLKIGAYTLPSTDGTSGQTLTTNGAGVVKWSTLSSGGGSQWTTNGSNIYYNSGSVGIGNSTPSLGGLVVDTKAGAVNAMFGSNTTGVAIESNYPGVGLNTFYNGGRKFIAAGYGGLIGLDPTSGLMGFYNSASSGSAAGTATLTADLAIAASGNVGIGTTTPTTGGLVVNTKAGAVNAMFGSNTTGVAIETSNPSIGLNTYYNNGRKFISSGYGAVIGLDPASGLLGFYNSAASGAAGASAITPADLAVTAAGNVGIGTTAPGAKLDVNGDALINGLTIGRGTGNFSSNVVTGYRAFVSNNGGGYNVASGYYTLYSNTSGSYNVATGGAALEFNATGSSNSAFGTYALYANTAGNSNIAIGPYALRNNTTQSNNIAIGDSALYNNGINTSISYQATYNTATGSKALYANTIGFDNTATGYQSLYANSEGYDNTAFGSVSLFSNTTGAYNTAIGESTLFGITTGNLNTACGSGALQTTVTGSNNTGLGYDVSIMNNYSGSTVIGSNATGTANSQVRVGDASITSIGGYVGWSNISDGRVKKNIQQNVPGLSFINKLNPITYNLNLEAADNIIQRTDLKDKSGNVIKPSQFEKDARKVKEQIVYTGFIAQDVEKAAKSLNYDFSGVDAAKNDRDLYGLRYAEFVVPLVKAVQELSKTNDAKDASIDSLKEQTFQQQKVNADLQQQINELKAIVLSGNSSSPNVPSSIKTQIVALSGAATLSQNIPNPFTNSTVINYYLPASSSNASINFYSENGTLLKSVTLSGSGNGNITLQASQLPSGVYRYTLSVSGKNIVSKQMILLK